MKNKKCRLTAAQFRKLYPPPTIDRRTHIHKLLDKNMNNKWVTCSNDKGLFSGPFLCHRHNRRVGRTFIVFLCTEFLSGDRVVYPFRTVILDCFDTDLNEFINIEQHPDADAIKKAHYGSVRMPDIKNAIKWSSLVRQMHIY